jgi:phenylalanine-4-hydroxylase
MKTNSERSDNKPSVYSTNQLVAIAERHGIRMQEVLPNSREQRLAELRKTLDDRNCPYPIAPDKARECYKRAEAGERFAIGVLSDATVDLGEYANTQNYEAYTFEEHLSWACLVAEQQRTKHQYACREYLEGEKLFEIGGTVIPDYYSLNARIYQQTRWQLATVSMIIPAELFFTCHSLRFFPVTTFMRPLEQDYLQEPDIGHDVAGHVATFTIPTVALVMQNHGMARDLIYRERDERIATARDRVQMDRICHRADELLLYAERIYWFTVEFGLVAQDDALRAFGAGILSSPGETQYSIDSPEANRILIDPSQTTDLMRLVSTDYLISEFQKTYFVTEDFSQLESLTPERIVRAAKLAARLPHFGWRDVVPGDRILNLGRVGTSVNEKYYRLMAHEPMDDCMKRTAIRNLRLYHHGMDQTFEGKPIDLDCIWRAPTPEVPPDAVQWFTEADAMGTFELPIRPLSYESDFF